jgi:hypothetical protein
VTDPQSPPQKSSIDALIERQDAKARAGVAKINRIFAVLLFTLAGLSAIQLVIAIASSGVVRARHGAGVLLVGAFAFGGGWYWRRRFPDRAL